MSADGEALDPRRMALVQARLDAIVRTMNSRLARSARSGILGVAHDYACCVLTAEDELLARPESIPLHTMRGPDIVSRWMRTWHPVLRRGDAFLHNSPYHGNSHAADWCILVPVVDDDGRHRFTIFARAHQRDCGNAEPTTYAFNARDVYEEGALIFPCVRAQTDYVDNEDLIRQCRMRIRVPDQWWGDYAALVEAARAGERRLLALMDEIGADVIDAYGRTLFDDAERRMVAAIRRLPRATRTATSRHDGFPRLPDGVPIRVTVSVDPDDARITVDLRDNPDCLPVGINLSEAASLTAALVGVFNSLSRVPAIDAEIPVNPGSLRRVSVLLRENCCVGIPTHPHSVSTATTNLQDRVVNPVMRCFAQMLDGIGLAEFGLSCPPAASMISGVDPRTEEPFINQLQLAVTGGPGGPSTDGWLTAYSAGASGMMDKDSVELDELHYPIRVREQRLLPDTAGDGRHRGAPAALVRIEAVGTSVVFMTNSDGTVNPPRGARRGVDGSPADQWIEQVDGAVREIKPFHREVLHDGDVMVSVSCSGGGYGPPLERDPEAVAADVREGWVSAEHALERYAVVVDDDGRLDAVATERERARRGPDEGVEALDDDGEDGGRWAYVVPPIATTPDPTVVPLRRRSPLGLEGRRSARDR